MVFSDNATGIMAAGGGCTYVFAIYSEAIKTSLGYDQKTLNTISFFKNLGASVGILPGLINEVAPPWVVLVFGAVMNLVGYLMIYLAISGRTARPPVWLMCVYIAVGANSQTFANTGVLVTTVKNFPHHRGLVLGLLTGFAGLSGAILTQLYHAFYGDKGVELVLLMAWLPAAMSLLFVLTIRIIPRNADGHPDSREREALVSFLRASMFPAVFLLILNVVEEVISSNKPVYATTTVLLLLLLLLPLWIVVKQELQTFMEAEQPTASATTSIVTMTTDANKMPSCFQDVLRPPARGENYSIPQALFSLDMLVLFVTTMCGIGGMLTAIDNISQIGQALGYPQGQGTISMLVSLVSLSSYAGRVVAGVGSDYAVARYKVPRALALAVVLVLAFLGHTLIALGARNGLYAASVILGFCIGAHWTVLFAIISEVFGLRYFSTLYNLGAMASPLGSYVLDVLVAGRLYDHEAPQGRGTCMGVHCFKLSFLIIAVVTLLSAATSLVLAWRTRELYHGDGFRLSRRTEGVTVTTDHI